ncbi:Variant-specific surface protein [Giardia duodenalis]|uniref:Variant-specific surface protein n=1 Tax=Giardia intestinalis TaxID=5741 RepID=V6TZL4_GIAIN|nr:Variant-specific surface protein [Giardia intestinalis]
MSVCRVGCALTHLLLRIQGYISRLVGQIVTALQLWCIYSSSDMDLHPPLGGCYDTRAAPGSGVCRKARGGACLRHAEEVTGRKKEPMRVREAQPGCTTGSSSTDHCQICDVIIGDKTYCSQCATGYVPIDGTCIQFGESSVTTTAGCKKNDDNSVDAQSTTCEKCTQTGYFLHKGGCYAQATPPGSAICKAAGAAGLCDECQAGYFKNPASASDATRQSCIACNDTTGADSNLGVASCVECTAPATSGSSSSSQKATCTKCASPKYLKADGTCGESSDCTGTTFPKADDKAGNKCAACDTVPDGGIADCGECSLLPSASRSSTPLVTCTKCSSGNLSPLKNECMTTCPAGTYAKDNICTPATRRAPRAPTLPSLLAPPATPGTC